MPTSTARPNYEDLGEFLRYVGNVSLKRIRMPPPPGTAAEADLLAALDGGTVLPGFKLSLSEFFAELDDDA